MVCDKLLFCSFYRANCIRVRVLGIRFYESYSCLAHCRRQNNGAMHKDPICVYDNYYRFIVMFFSQLTLKIKKVSDVLIESNKCPIYFYIFMQWVPLTRALYFSSILPLSSREVQLNWIEKTYYIWNDEICAYWCK